MIVFISDKDMAKLSIRYNLHSSRCWCFDTLYLMIVTSPVREFEIERYSAGFKK